MRLRALVMLFLFGFAMIPTVAVIAYNLPITLERLQDFNRQGHLQNLRVEFGDLEQFLVSRKEMLRLLTKLPDEAELSALEAPGGLPGRSRQLLIDWINRLLSGARDVYEVQLLSNQGQVRLSLRRDGLNQPLLLNPLAEPELIQRIHQVGMSMQAGDIFISPIYFSQPGDRHPTMVMRMISPVHDITGRFIGVASVSLDVSGLPAAHPNTQWVMNSGLYLDGEGNAFKDYPGLQTLFETQKLSLWEGERQQALWIPMFVSEDRGPIWVGRVVDPSGVDDFRRTLTERVLLIFLVLLIVSLLVARWIAQKVASYGEELTRGIEQVLDQQSSVVFSWRGPKELKVLAADLTRLADSHAETTRELYERAQELEESNRYKSEFLANMSHELRTPLNSILLLSRLLKENRNQALSAEQVQQAGVIHTAGSDLLKLINNILDISKIEAQHTSVHLQRLNTAEFWQSLPAMFAPLAEEKGLKLRVRHDKGLPSWIESDGDRLNQILKNLLANAIKFTEQGEVLLRICRNPYDDAGQRPLCIQVVDSGIGIAQEKQALVFEAFRQLDGATNRRHGGTGLGLAISRRLAELLGARLHLESTQGQGSCFSLLLPLTIDTQGWDPERISIADGEPDMTMPVQTNIEAPKAADEQVPINTLLLEPDLDQLISLVPCLESAGARVNAVESAAELLEVLQDDQAPDLLLLCRDAPDLDLDALIGRARECFDGPIMVNITDGQAKSPQKGVIFKPLPTDVQQCHKTLVDMMKHRGSPD